LFYYPFSVLNNSLNVNSKFMEPAKRFCAEAIAYLTGMIGCFCPVPIYSPVLPTLDKSSKDIEMLSIPKKKSLTIDESKIATKLTLSDLDSQEDVSVFRYITL